MSLFSILGSFDGLSDLEKNVGKYGKVSPGEVPCLETRSAPAFDLNGDGK